MSYCAENHAQFVQSVSESASGGSSILKTAAQLHNEVIDLQKNLNKNAQKTLKEIQTAHEKYDKIS
jgi:hypothetical protein